MKCSHTSYILLETVFLFPYITSPTKQSEVIKVGKLLSYQTFRVKLFLSLVLGLSLSHAVIKQGCLSSVQVSCLWSSHGLPMLLTGSLVAPLILNYNKAMTTNKLMSQKKRLRQILYISVIPHLFSCQSVMIMCLLKTRSPNI